MVSAVAASGDDAVRALQPGFRITARTLFHLGADLISSDAMALYELVKNTFDADSERVAIAVVSRVPVAVANPIIDRIARAVDVEEDDGLDDDDDEDAKDYDLDELRAEALATLAEFEEDPIYAAV